MCVHNEAMPVWQRLVGLVPMLGFVAIEFCRPGIWRHVWVMAEMVLLVVVIALMFSDRRRNRDRRI
jgi:hypothetical protein